MPRHVLLILTALAIASCSPARQGDDTKPNMSPAVGGRNVETEHVGGEPRRFTQDELRGFVLAAVQINKFVEAIPQDKREKLQPGVERAARRIIAETPAIDVETYTQIKRRYKEGELTKERVQRTLLKLIREQLIVPGTRGERRWI